MLGRLLTDVFAAESVGGTPGLLEGNPGAVVIQLWGIGVVTIYRFVMAFLLLRILDALIGIRTSAYEEAIGLDSMLHGKDDIDDDKRSTESAESEMAESRKDTNNSPARQARMGASSVAAGSAGSQIIDVSDPSDPFIVGGAAIPGGAVKDLVVRNTQAYVAAFTGGFQAVDFIVPDDPQVIGGLPGSSPFGFVSRDVELSVQFALAAEQLFPIVVLIVDAGGRRRPPVRGLMGLTRPRAGDQPLGERQYLPFRAARTADRQPKA